MPGPDLELCSAGRRTIKTTPTFLFLSIFCMYLIVRCLAWKNTILLEDTDSLFYLNNIKEFLSFDLQNIINLDADSTPFYPFFGALFSLPGWSVETGARLTSLFFSSVLYLSVVGIGKRIGRPLEVSLGLLILTFSPVLIPLSFSVLTEPSYIAMIYLGFWFFWTQYENPRFWKAGLLGVIFGLSFLNRVEGLLYLVIIPLLQGAYFLFGKRKYYSFKRITGWIIIFIMCFSFIAIPQIWRVSHKMGYLAINGRQVWMQIINNPDGKSNREKKLGLDFSPSQINIVYAKNHPEVLEQSAATISPVHVLKTYLGHFNDLYQRKLGTLIGPLGLIFFAFGLLELYKRGRRFEAFLILAFIGSNLAAPLTTVVRIRYIAIIAPLIMLMEGFGIVYLSQRLLKFHNDGSWRKLILPFMLFFILIGASAIPLLKTFRPPHFNKEYSPIELKEPVAIVKKIAENDLLRTPIIVSGKSYLSYFTDGRGLRAPYDDYEALVKYSNLNNVDFLYLKHNRFIKHKYPFFKAFLQDIPPPDFVLLYSGVDEYGGKIELYRFRGNTQ